MNKNQRIGIVFVGIITAVFIAVIVSALPMRTVNEWLQHYDFLSDTDRENIVLDLQDAGYDLSRSYNEHQITRAMQRMVQRGDTRFDWEYYLNGPNGLIAGCTHENWAGTDSYSKCSETCADSSACYTCCNNGFPYEADRRYCKPYCDKMGSPATAQVAFAIGP
jgi:hypothetical protein